MCLVDNLTKNYIKIELFHNNNNKKTKKFFKIQGKNYLQGSAAIVESQAGQFLKKYQQGLEIRSCNLMFYLKKQTTWESQTTGSGTAAEP